MTPAQLAAIEATLAEARPLPDTGHHGACGCPDCRTVWQHADGIPAAAARLVRVHVPDLIAEVRRLSKEETAQAEEGAAQVQRLDDLIARVGGLDPSGDLSAEEAEAMFGDHPDR